MGDIEFCNIDTSSYLNNVKDTNFFYKNVCKMLMW